MECRRELSSAVQRLGGLLTRGWRAVVGPVSGHFFFIDNSICEIYNHEATCALDSIMIEPSLKTLLSAEQALVHLPLVSLL